MFTDITFKCCASCRLPPTVEKSIAITDNNYVPLVLQTAAFRPGDHIIEPVSPHLLDIMILLCVYLCTDITIQVFKQITFYNITNFPLNVFTCFVLGGF